MYLSKSRIIITQLFSWIIIFGSVFLCFLGISGVGLVISAIGGERKYMEENEIPSSLAVYIGFIAVGAGFLIWAIRNLRLAGKANKINSIFESDKDGIIDIAGTSRRLGMSEENFIALFDKLVSKGYLIDCSMELEPALRIVLNNGAKNAEDLFEVVSCPGCGAPQTVKVGYVERCPYCGSDIKAIKRSRDY
ncbi:MAG: hypothetical protein IJX77_03810 [Ruminococcus sp.]|nr:hypothetical protein [Ruminococcus sp.]